MADGAQCMGLPRPWQPEGKDVYALVYEVSPDQVIELLSELDGKPVMLEGIPDLAYRQPGGTSEPDDTPLSAVLSLLFQNLRSNRTKVRKVS